MNPNVEFLIAFCFHLQGVAAGAKKPTDQELAVLVITQLNLFFDYISHFNKIIQAISLGQVKEPS